MSKLTIEDLVEAAKTPQTHVHTTIAAPFTGKEITFRTLNRGMAKVWRQALREGDPDSMEILLSLMIVEPAMTPAHIAVLNQQNDDVIGEWLDAGSAWQGWRKPTPAEEKAEAEAAAKAAESFRPDGPVGGPTAGERPASGL